MRYFLLSQDRRYNRTPRTFGLFYILDRKDVCPERAHKLPAHMIVRTEDREEYDLPDLLNDDSLFLLSDEAKHVFSFHDKGIVFKTFMLLSRDGNMQAKYNLPVIEDIPCLHGDSEYGEYGELKKPILDRGKIFGKSIFRIGEDAQKLAVRLDAAESLLRGNLKGFVFTEIEAR
jgi:hypothetical protein